MGQKIKIIVIIGVAVDSFYNESMSHLACWK